MVGAEGAGGKGKKGGLTTCYKLFGVVQHHGKSLEGGHYTCDVLHTHGRWLHFDDTIVSLVTEKQVQSRPLRFVHLVGGVESRPPDTSARATTAFTRW